MGKLRMVLPPYAPDYSGVCAALFSMGQHGLTVIHDAAGCTGNYTGYDEPRWYHSKAPVYCSGLREIDAILGDDEKLIQKVMEACETIKPEIAALVGSPVPMVIGTDLEGIAADLENRLSIPVFGFATTGLGSYQRGIELVYEKVLCRILSKEDIRIKKPSRTVNILGATPLDFGMSGTIEDLCRLLEEDGWQVQTILYKADSIGQIKKIINADCSIVVSGAAFPFAEYLKNEFEIPYLTGLPFGAAYTQEWKKRLECCAAGKIQKKSEDWKRSEVTGLILGEQVQACSIRDGLFAAYGIRADVGAVCGFLNELAEEGEMFLEEETDIEAAVNDQRYRFVIGDPLYEALIPEGKKLIPYAHYALSSKLGQKYEMSLIGEKMEQQIKL